jgi:hypothetical protein
MAGGRTLLTWLLWSPRHAALAAAATLAAAAAVAWAVPRAGPAARTPASAPPPAAATAAARAPAPPPSRPAPAAAPAAAVTAGEDFAAAWASPGPGWLARTARYATPQLAARLALAEPALADMPVTRVTGPARVTARAPGTVTLSVPTDAGPALVTVLRAGGRWLAGAVTLAREGS